MFKSEERKRFDTLVLKPALRRLGTFSNGDERLMHDGLRRLSLQTKYIADGIRPVEKRVLKARIIAKQKGLCPICSKPLGPGAELDRMTAGATYKQSRLRVVHRDCHRAKHERRKWRA